MPTAIQNLVVLGDSLSDIGIKREAPAGMFARAAGMMRTNEVGRYSDGKNWADYLIEWIGGEPLIRGDKKNTEYATAPHRTLTTDSLVLRTNFGDLAPVKYANYAEGGAIAASDWKPKAGALGYLKEQVSSYINARRKLIEQNQFTGHTLHVIWIGLNDLITAKRPVPDNPGPTDAAGTGVRPLVREINDLVNEICDSFPTNPSFEHFVLIDLPSPLVSIRFQDKAADKGEDSVAKAVANVQAFNTALRQLATHWVPPKDGLGAFAPNISFVRIADWMQVVSNNPQQFNLTPLAQDHGPVLYLGMQDPTPPAIRRALTTSDLAHPTQAVYELIARQIADTLVPNYRIGTLTTTSWPERRPFPTIPGI
ncbi:SGNH/GDSL hydrolase family protein [Nocardia sp. NPDC052001]|uniref:SGNH/GDSL hydrolase family protein n=1 Tax=Nocardia sp. NPDC052001 TaxID=3154853 RepID=UPI003418A69A